MNEAALAALFTPDWRRIRADVPQAPWCASWLRARDSLTQCLQAVCRHGFRVERLRHEWCALPLPSGRRFLQLPAHEPVLWREVLLCDGDVPLVFACSLLPEGALHGRYAALRELGNAPLGQWLFQQPALQRQWFHYACLPPGAKLWPTDLPLDEPVWGRRTRFVGAARPMLVSEFFLPALRAYRG